MKLTPYLSYQTDPERGVIYGVSGKRVGVIGQDGYIKVHGPKGFWGKGHRMIWESVHGPIPERMEINHINGVKTDNRIENLELVTSSENKLHAYRTGLRNAAGERNGFSKMTNDTVLSIRKRVKDGEILRAIAIDLRLSKSAIRHVANGTNWSHLP